jgi:hypothetical protein
VTALDVFTISHAAHTGATPASPAPGTIPDMTDVRRPAPVRHEGRDLALQSRRTLGLADLLERRPELRGISGWAEEVVGSVLWSA